MTGINKELALKERQKHPDWFFLRAPGTHTIKNFKKRNTVKKLLKIQPLKMFKVKTHQRQSNAGHYSKVEKGI